MDHHSSRGLQQFNNNVGIKFQLYNSLFSSLPFHRIEKTGIYLSVLLSNCEEGFKKKMNPTDIIDDFFEKHTTFKTEKEKLDMLFRIIQFVERQVVLFDALEDAAFTDVKDMAGAGTLKQLELEVIKNNKEKELEKKLKDFSVQLVLTAHPTQFYPGTVLGIINDLSKALSENDAAKINIYLQQLGKTPFLQKQRPTPFDEAISLIWYLENVFYQAAGRITSFLKNQFNDALPKNKSIINMGFWPGGDRDGNPFVTAEITLKVAHALRGSIIKCYYLDIRRIKRRLTFKGIDVILNGLEKQLYDNIFIPGYQTELSKEYILDELNKIKEIIIYQHNGLFLHLVNNLINKVNVFGLHFASLDIRQESTVHNTVLEAIHGEAYSKLSTAEKISFCVNAPEVIAEKNYTDALVQDTVTNLYGIKKVQQLNGEAGCNRYIISQCNSALNVLEVYGLFLSCGWKAAALTVDIVPLFETIDDLQHASAIMNELYSNAEYRKYLKLRNNRQTIMLGFSDGTKDGGYLMANFSIYKAKEALTKISKEYHIDVVFFDGRGGPPARGGGKTHQFYASMGKNISNKEIQLTIQGQTVSSNFGTIDSAQYNIEQLIHAGISNDLFSSKEITLQHAEEDLLLQLAGKSFEAYVELKNHPDFLDYLSHVSPVKFYSETNIASRPSKRNSGSKLTLKDLRAIPYVGAWAQLKQNVTGYYGVGSALAAMEKAGKFSQVKELYSNSLFFRTLMDNCEMAMKKCYFPLTEYLSNDNKYGEIWNKIYQEYELTKKYVLQLSGSNELMSTYPVDSLSIAMREKIVLPLLTIQQYAINKMREMDEQLVNSPVKEIYEKLVIRSSFGIINAGRNSA
ncbi:phosphoenolpyruvate carboxylase [Ferruginibacter sp. SUN106]|uniref:phosphoenolpyruvate carboxylase n=1 Tax=Ferruginibacter sp. SUN106 TaxID=2978348 RepID=UPI003D35EE39